MRNHLIRQQRQQLDVLIQQRDRLMIKESELRRQHQALEQARESLSGLPRVVSGASLLNQGLIKQQLTRVLNGHQQQLMVAEQDQERLARLSRQQAGKVKGLELLEQQRRQRERQRQQRQEWENQLEWCLNRR